MYIIHYNYLLRYKSNKLLSPEYQGYIFRVVKYHTTAFVNSWSENNANADVIPLQIHSNGIFEFHILQTIHNLIHYSCLDKT